MFEDSLLDSGGRGKTKKPATVAISFLAQSVAVGILIVIPLVYTEALPQHVLTRLLMMPPPPAPPRPAAVPTVVPVRVTAVRPQREFVQPRHIPESVAMLREDPLPPTYSASVSDRDTISSGPVDDFLSGPVDDPPPPPLAPEPERTVVGGAVMAARLVCRVQPIYPPLVRQARIQGTVMLRAVISEEGRIANLQAVSGHPLLIPAALDAVRQWCYQPTLLNGVPTEVETTVEVHFKLGS